MRRRLAASAVTLVLLVAAATAALAPEIDRALRESTLRLVGLSSPSRSIGCKGPSTLRPTPESAPMSVSSPRSNAACAGPRRPSRMTSLTLLSPSPASA